MERSASRGGRTIREDADTKIPFEKVEGRRSRAVDSQEEEE